MLFAINFSATQALDKQLQAEKARNDELQVRLQALEARIQAVSLLFEGAGRHYTQSP